MTDPIHIVETAYQFEATTETEWLTRVADAVRSNIPMAKTAVALAYHVQENGWIDVCSSAELGTPHGFIGTLLSTVGTAKEVQDATANYYRASGLRSGLTLVEPFLDLPDTYAYYQRALLGYGFRDILTVNAFDPTRSGCMIGMPLPTVSKLHRSTSAQWDRIATHIAAGFRLHSKLRRLERADPTSVADAVLTPNGRVEHATGIATERSSRETLRSAVLAVDRARGPLRRRDPGEALAVWRGLVAGRWSLVDHFDRDGRRYLVAHHNELEAPDPRALTPRERQVIGYASLGHSNKLIAYELGLSRSTISVLLGRATAKLGAREPARVREARKRRVAGPRR
jgi:DNA-binding CsgD family transcriptional regulator